MKFNSFNFRALKKGTSIIIISFIVGSVLFNCKKDTNKEPIVTINLPLAGQTVLAGDSIYVEADILDDNELVTVSVQLLYLDESPASSASVYQTNNNSFHINALYHINNILLESGTYYLTVSANDGTHTTRQAREVQIQSLPIERLKIFALTTAGNNVKVFDLDSAQGYSLFTTVTSDYLRSSFSSQSKRLNILPRTNGTYKILDAITGVIFNEVSGICPISTPCFNNLTFQNELNFISYFDGNIKGFDSNGLQKFEVQQGGFFRADATFLLNDYFFAELDYINPQVKKLGTFFYPSGVATLEATIDIDIIKMLKRSQDEIFLLGHLNGSCVIEVFNKLSNRSSPLRNIGQMTLYSAYNFQSTNIFLATDQGLWSYNIALNSVTQVRNQALQLIEYDPIFNEYFIAEQNTIRVLDGSTFQAKKSYNLPDSVVNIHFLYSR